jgi:hypothetical protein
MKHPIQTDRLEDGHHATFEWTSPDGTLRRETWIVGLSFDSSTLPVTRSTDWLKPFLNKPVGFSAELPEPEGNVLEYRLVELKLPVRHKAA